MPEYDDDNLDSDYEEDEEQDEEDEGSYLFDYDYAPNKTSFVLDDGTEVGRNDIKRTDLFLGVELEVCSPAGERRYDVESLEGFSDKIYMKKDGSLDDNNGFEIVTKPLSPKFAYQFFPKLSEILRTLQIAGHSAGAGYGMHVHISRSALTPLHQAKLIVFMSDTNRELLVNVAQRDNSQWCEIREKGIEHPSNLFEDYDKYQALNVQHYATLEFRIFRSNMDAKRILKNIDFVLATVAFTKQCGINELTTDHFLKWLKNNRKQYMYLYKFLSEKEEGSNYPGRYADVLNYRRTKRTANA